MQLSRLSWKQSFFFSLFFAIALVLVAAPAWTQQAPASDAEPGSAPVPSQAPAAPASGQQDPYPNKPSLAPGIDPKTRTPLYEEIQEDWSSLQIGASKLRPEPPLVGQVDEQETYTRTLVQVKWRPGDAIDLWIVMPKGVKNPPAVLYLYNASEDTERFRSDVWCRHVTRGGVAAVGFVSALTASRFHDRPLKQWFVSELQESLGSTVHDVKFILDYLAQRGDIDMSRIGMLGIGSGGTIAILAAAADARIKAVDALDPWGDWPHFLAESPVVLADPDHAEYVKPEFLKKVAPLDPVKWLPELKTPIRIQLVRENDATPMECKESIRTAAPKQAEILRFEALSDLGHREGQGRLFQWIKDRLESSDKPGQTTAPGGPVATGTIAAPQVVSSQSLQK
jgi:dienelactone hydrolase